MDFLVESISEVAPCPLTPSQEVFPAGAFLSLCRLLLYFVTIGLPNSNSPVDCLNSMLENEEALTYVCASVPFQKAI